MSDTSETPERLTVQEWLAREGVSMQEMAAAQERADYEGWEAYGVGQVRATR